MKKIYMIAALAMCALTASAVVPSSSSVFSGKRVKSLGEEGEKAVLSYNADWQLVSIQDAYDKSEFTYKEGTLDGFSYQVVMNQNDEYEDMTIYMALNNRGFVTKCQQATHDKQEDEWEYDNWEFDYDVDGHLVKMYRSEGEETTTITWEDGYIVKVETVEAEDNSKRTTTFTYSDKENKSGFMLFDQMFGVDMDEMESAYFGGMLGTPSRLLPSGYTEEDEWGKESIKIAWTIDADGYPTRITLSDDSYYESYEIEWTDGPTGVAEVEVATGAEAWYNLQGVRIAAPEKGIYLHRDANGNIRKELLK